MLRPFAGGHEYGVGDFLTDMDGSAGAWPWRQQVIRAQLPNSPLLWAAPCRSPGWFCVSVIRGWLHMLLQVGVALSVVVTASYV